MAKGVVVYVRGGPHSSCTLQIATRLGDVGLLVKATESKTRFIAPLISLMIMNKSLDNDAERHGGREASGEANVGGRTLGGGSGFGLLGSLAAQSSKYVGSALGIYGMAWSVYNSVVARGGEVQFGKNAVVLQADFLKCVQNPNESSKLYAERFIKLARRAGTSVRVSGAEARVDAGRSPGHRRR